MEAVKILVLGILSLQFMCARSSDVLALRKLGVAWNFQENWAGEEPCRLRWKGVFCDKETNSKVTKLVLNNMNLSGDLLPEIGDLVDLQELDLSFNPSLKGKIPASIGALNNLILLNLQECGFTGYIPGEIGQLGQLKFIALNGNSLNGSIPFTLGHLKAVEWCDLSFNYLTGLLPVSSTNDIGLDNMTALRHMHLNNNRFYGFIPPEISTMPRLQHLLLDHNGFSGSIPPQFGNFTSLTIMRLDHNQLQGNVPNSLGGLASLIELHLSSNLFQQLPDLSTLQRLQLLRASNLSTKRSGLPLWIAQLRNLKTLELQGNNHFGGIPSDILSLPSLEAILLDDNQLSGTLDLTYASNSLAFVSLNRNNISSVSSKPSRIMLSLAANPLCTTKTAGSFCNVSDQLWLAPSASCGRKVCDLDKTLLPATCTCAYPLIATLQFVSPAFSAITLEKINNATEQFASSLGLAREQVWIGSADFTSDHRFVMNVLFFPRGNDTVFEASVVSSILSLLSTQMVNLPDFGPFLLTSTNQPVTALPALVRRAKRVFILTVIIAVAVSAAIAASCILAFCILRRRTQKARRERVAPSKAMNHYGRSGIASEIAPRMKGCRWFTLDELRRASGDFVDENLIGVGGYGQVYKGKLENGALVAIKKAKTESLQGLTEFKNEIELLSRLHHKNLVNLLGFCTDGGEQVLVYEYMANRTLRDHLEEHSQALDWKMRLAIALGSAKGLEYLHELADPPIIHRDIKSSNILLDENYVAKVADFGLSKLAPASKDGETYTITQVKGTLGYLDPEYYVYQQLSEKSDVYSFGVVLIELATGKQPIQKGTFIVRQIKDCFNSGGAAALFHLLDPHLGHFDEDEMSKFLELALHCVEDSGHKRPRMNQVVKRLGEIVVSASGSQDVTCVQVEVQQQVLEPSFGRLEVGITEPSFTTFSFRSSGGTDFSFHGENGYDRVQENEGEQ